MFMVTELQTMLYKMQTSLYPLEVASTVAKLVEVDPCFLLHSKKIMVDVDMHEINKMPEKDVKIDLGIVSDAKNFLR